MAPRTGIMGLPDFMLVSISSSFCLIIADNSIEMLNQLYVYTRIKRDSQWWLTFQFYLKDVLTHTHIEYPFRKLLFLNRLFKSKWLKLDKIQSIVET